MPRFEENIRSYAQRIHTEAEYIKDSVFQFHTNDTHEIRHLLNAMRHSNEKINLYLSEIEVINERLVKEANEMADGESRTGKDEGSS